MKALCAFDGQDEEWHKSHSTRHEFSPTGQLSKAEPSKEPEAKPTVQRADLVLRATLIRKGLLSLSDLEEIERQLAVGGVVVIHESAAES